MWMVKVYVEHCVEDRGSSLCDFADGFLILLVLGSYFFFFWNIQCSYPRAFQGSRREGITVPF